MTDPTPDNRQSRKERERAQHRRDILDVAVVAFAELGFHQTTMQMIADRAEFSVGYLYKHFAGKDEMYQEMIHFHIGRMNAILESVEAKGLAPLAELREMFEASCEHFNHHQDFMRIYHQGLSHVTDELQKKKDLQFEITVAALDHAQAAGEIRPCDSRLVAAVMMGASAELFRELAGRSSDAPFSTLTENIFALIVDPLRIS